MDLTIGGPLSTFCTNVFSSQNERRCHKEIAEKALKDIILSFLRKQESSIFKVFCPPEADRFRGNYRKVGFSELSQ